MPERTFGVPLTNLSRKKPGIAFICPRQLGLPKPKRSFRFTLPKPYTTIHTIIHSNLKTSTLYTHPPSYYLHMVKLLRELFISILYFMMPTVISSHPLSVPSSSTRHQVLHNSFAISCVFYIATLQPVSGSYNPPAKPNG